MTCPAEVMLKDSSLNAEEWCPRQDLVFGDIVLPNDANDSSEFCLLEQLQMFDIPGLTSIQKGGEDHGLEANIFGFHGEALIAEDWVWVHSVCSMSHFDPVVKVSFTGDIIWDDATKVGKFIDNFY